jgi:hypothetical protein
MAATPQIFAQLKPSALVNQTLFTVMASSRIEVSIFINNQGTEYDGFNIALIPSGQTGPTPSQFLALNTQLAAGTTVAFSGIYLNQGDSVVVGSSLGNCAFLATGINFST